MNKKRITILLLSISLIIGLMSSFAYASVEYNGDNYDLHIVKPKEGYYLTGNVEGKKGETATFHLRKDWFYIIDNEGNKIYGDKLDNLNLDDEFNFQWRKYSRILDGQTKSTCTVPVNGGPSYETNYYCDIYSKKSNNKLLETVCFEISNPDSYKHFEHGNTNYRYRYVTTTSYSELAIGEQNAVIGHPDFDEGDFCESEQTDVSYLYDGDWGLVSTKDAGWSYEWKDAKGKKVKNTDNITVQGDKLIFKQVTSEDIQKYDCVFKFYNRVVCERFVDIEEGPQYTMLEDGKYRCKQFNYYGFKDVKKGYASTLEPSEDFYDFDSDDDNFILIQKKIVSKDSKGNERIRWRETSDLNASLKYAWTKDDNPTTLCSTETMKIKKVTEDSFGCYTLTVRYKNSVLGTAKYELEEDDSIFISKSGKSNYGNPRNGDSLIKEYSDDREVGIQPGHPLKLTHTEEMPIVCTYYYDWCEECFVEDILTFNWTLDGKTIAKDKPSISFAGEKITAEMVGKTITCTGYFRNKPIYVVNYKLIDAPGLEKVTYKKAPMLVDGEELALTAVATANTDKVDITYQWFELVEVDGEDGIYEVYQPISNKISDTTFKNGTIVDSDKYEYVFFSDKTYAFKVFITGKDQYRGFKYESNFFPVYTTTTDVGVAVPEGSKTKHVARSGKITRYELNPRKNGWYAVEFSDDGSGSDVCGVWYSGLRTANDNLKKCKHGDHYCKFKATAGEKLYLYVDPVDEFDDIVNVVVKFYKKSAPHPVMKKLPLRVKQTILASKNLKREKGDYISKVKSSNKKVVKVVGKKIKGVKAGTATITVTTDCGFRASYKVRVQKTPVACSKLTIGCKSSVNIKKGKKLRINARTYPMTCKQKITYASSNKKIATVSSKGVIKALKKGNCKVTVRCGKKVRSIKVGVKS